MFESQKSSKGTFYLNLGQNDKQSNYKANLYSLLLILAFLLPDTARQ